MTYRAAGEHLEPVNDQAEARVSLIRLDNTPKAGAERFLRARQMIEAQQAYRVPTCDLVDRELVKVTELLSGGLPGVRPGAVRVGIVGLEDDIVAPHLIDERNAHGVFEEAAVHLTSPIVGRRGFGAVSLGITPPAVGLPDIVSSLQDVWNPPNLRLGVHEVKPGVSMKDS